MTFSPEGTSSLVHFGTLFICYMDMDQFEIKRIAAGQMHVHSEGVHHHTVSHQTGILVVF